MKRLTEETVRLMRSAHEQQGLGYTKIGLAFDVDRTTAWKVCTYRTHQMPERSGVHETMVQ